MRFKSMAILLICSGTLLVFNGCYPTVPKEVVKLSYTVGQDMEAIHLSYKALIRKHFDTLRSQANAYLDNRWTPTYLGEFIKTGDLVKTAQDPNPVKAFEGVSAWVEVAIEEIENKRKELLSPVDQDENALLQSVDEAFSRIIRANSAITAHLNSIRKVQEVQDEALKALNLKDLRQKVEQQLSSASERAEKAIENLKKAEEKIKKAQKKK